MNLECLNDIITDSLAIHIDLTDIDSWNLNSGLTSVSLTKWSGAISDNLNLIDYGLTAFDVGRIDKMWSGMTLTPKDTLFKMYRIGFNNVANPTTEEYSGVTVNTEYLPMTGITSGASGNYFELAGGYLQGFFKLDGYNYTLLPSRFNYGITIETVVYLYPDSQGIFYLMGARAEDKYNPHFSGETITGGTSENINVTDGVITSEDNYLDDIVSEEKLNKTFIFYEDLRSTVHREINPSANTTNNVIAFEITQDKKLAYKYIDGNGIIQTNKSVKSIDPSTGWTIISIVFEPDEVIEDLDVLDCYPQRKGKFVFYVNGRALWTIIDFPEFFFKAFINDKEKQIGVPYSINWGGGSFGLKYSWHYDKQSYNIYNENNTQYILDNFNVESTPLPGICEPYAPGTKLDGLSLSADTTTFHNVDKCDPTITKPITVMRIEYTGGTGLSGQTGTSANTYFVKFMQPISVLSNRDYAIRLYLYNDGFFNQGDQNGFLVDNTISIYVMGTTDIDIVDEVDYIYPLTKEKLLTLPNVELKPFPDNDEFQYVALDGVSYYGDTGLPVYTDPMYYEYYGFDHITGEIPISGAIVTGEREWIPMKTTFRTANNSGQQFIEIGVLIRTSYKFNLNKPLFIQPFTYTGSDILVQDERKNNLQIEQNFDSTFIGGIQKLRVYDRGLSSTEILHNAKMEALKNPNLGLNISIGGRIIYR
jgi:hypothetical protein